MTAFGAESLDIPSSIDTPSLVVDRTLLRRNLSRMQSFADQQGIALVPHVKTHRTSPIAQMQMDIGAKALCVAKLGEAEVLHAAGMSSFVMAYPIVGTSKYERAAALIEQGVDLTLCVEDGDIGRELGAVMTSHGCVADVAILVDTGYLRDGIAPRDVPGLAKEISAVAGLCLRGVLTHEGGPYGLASFEDFTRAAIEAGELITSVAANLRRSGFEIDLVSVGSTATAEYTGAVSGVTQLRAGIYPFNDRGQLLRGVCDIGDCAARVVATIVSANRAGRALIDAGSKSLGQDRLSIHMPNAPTSHGLLCDLPGWTLESLSEEHGWLTWTGSGSAPMVKPGSRVQVLPNHICSAFHVLGESVVVESGVVVDHWVADARGASR